MGWDIKNALLTLAHACSRFVKFPRFFLGSPRFFLRSPRFFLRSYIDTAHACSRLLTIAHGCSRLLTWGHKSSNQCMQVDPFLTWTVQNAKVCMPWCYALMNFSCNNNCLKANICARLKHWVKGSQPKIGFGLPNAKLCLLLQKQSDVLQLSVAPIEWRFHGLAKGSCLRHGGVSIHQH